jgi:hypothetical protein
VGEAVGRLLKTLDFGGEPVADKLRRAHGSPQNDDSVFLGLGRVDNLEGSEIHTAVRVLIQSSQDLFPSPGRRPDHRLGGILPEPRFNSCAFVIQPLADLGHDVWGRAQVDVVQESCGKQRENEGLG